MKFYRYELSGVVCSIVDNEDGTPLVIRQISDAGHDRPRNINGRIYRALHILDVWRKQGRPGEILKENP